MRASSDDIRAVQTMPTSALVCRPQVRELFDEESLAGLAQTIKETGILQPLLVRRSGSEFIVLEGERRLRAARMAGLTQIPVIVDDRELSEGEVVYRQLVVNCSREGLEPLEKARAIARLMEVTKQTASQVAVKLGMSPSMVAKLLALLRLPESVQEQVARGALPAMTAYALSQAGDAKAQQELASEAVSGALRRDDVVRRTKGRKGKPRRTSPPGKPGSHRGRVILPIGEGCDIRAPARGVTVQALSAWVSAFLGRVEAVEPKDMELADAAKTLAAPA